MTFEMTGKTRTITVYNLRADTAEFIGKSDAYIPPYTGLPANSTVIAPPKIPAGKVAVFNADKQEWALHEDHRGKVVYDSAMGQRLYITDIGSLPENTVTTSPSSDFDKWNGKAWVKDAAAEAAFLLAEAKDEKTRLLSAANAAIAPLQDAVDLDIATDAEKTQLTAWKTYRVLLNRVDPSTDEFPQVPGDVA